MPTLFFDIMYNEYPDDDWDKFDDPNPGDESENSYLYDELDDLEE